MSALVAPRTTGRRRNVGLRILSPLVAAGLLLYAPRARAQQPPSPELPQSAVPHPLPPGSPPPAGARPDGLWLMDDDVVLDIYHCGLMVCGRISWMRKPRDYQGRPVIDNHNPDPQLRPRTLCNQTIIEGLQPDGPDAWKNGHAYDPRTGSTYSVDATYEADGTVHARLYRGLTILGETKTLMRVAQGHTDGWCPVYSAQPAASPAR